MIFIIVNFVTDPTTTSLWKIANYSYLGADTSVVSAYAEPAVELTYIKQGSEPKGPAGDPYAGPDRFGRIIDHRWIKGGGDVERIQYGYNFASLRQWRLDTIAHAAYKNQDNYYSYDGLGQVTARDQGQLVNDCSGISGIPVAEEDWIYDPSGNWNNYQQKTAGTLTVNQTRTHNEVNEIKTYDGSGIPVVFDAAGNMTRMPRELAGTSYYEATWDAWNRLVRVKTPGTPGGYGSYSGANLDVRYAYDGEIRRTTKQILTGPDSGTRHYYYNAEWKCIEERNGSSASASKQFVFGSRGRNDLVFREQFGLSAARLYALCDNMGSKVAITDATGVVLERYAFTAFGDLESVMTSDYGPRTNSLYHWETLFHGEFRDRETGYYNYGYRYYLPEIGRWAGRDPISEYVGAVQQALTVRRNRVYMAPWILNPLYAFVSNRAINEHDVLGLETDATGPCCDPCGNYQKAHPENTDNGGVVCCDGKKYSCAWGNQAIFKKDPSAQGVADCVKKHEDHHQPNVQDCAATGGAERPFLKPEIDSNKEECEAYKAEAACLEEGMKNCGGNGNCQINYTLALQNTKAQMKGRYHCE